MPPFGLLHAGGMRKDTTIMVSDFRVKSKSNHRPWLELYSGDVPHQFSIGGKLHRKTYPVLIHPRLLLDQ